VKRLANSGEGCELPTGAGAGAGAIEAKREKYDHKYASQDPRKRRFVSLFAYEANECGVHEPEWHGRGIYSHPHHHGSSGTTHIWSFSV
jgi:hypothetical protein